MKAFKLISTQIQSSQLRDTAEADKQLSRVHQDAITGEVVRGQI